MNRSNGLLDYLPEVIAPPIREKLRFIHGLADSTPSPVPARCDESGDGDKAVAKVWASKWQREGRLQRNAQAGNMERPGHRRCQPGEQPQGTDCQLITNTGALDAALVLLKATMPFVYLVPVRAMLTVVLPNACCCCR